MKKKENDEQSYYKKHKKKLQKRARAFYKRHRKRCIKRSKEYQAKHKKQIKIRMKRWREEHKEEIKQSKRVYNKKHNKQIRKSNRIRAAKRLKTDVQFKLRASLRNRMNMVIKRQYRAGSAVRDLGCSVEFLKQYLESLFYSTMTWENWGSIWELDHVIPLHKSDLTNREQFLKAANYTNMQPLTIKDHARKSAAEEKERRRNKCLKTS